MYACICEAEQDRWRHLSFAVDGIHSDRSLLPVLLALAASRALSASSLVSTAPSGAALSLDCRLAFARARTAIRRLDAGVGASHTRQQEEMAQVQWSIVCLLWKSRSDHSLLPLLFALPALLLVSAARSAVSSS